MPGDFRVISKSEWRSGWIYSAREKISSRLVTIYEIRCNSVKEALIIRNRIVASSRLRHENIARVFNCIIEAQSVFTITESLDGETLAGKLRRGEIERYYGIKWLKEALDGLSFASSKGITHGNVTVDSLFITNDNTLKVLDFGIDEPRGNDFSSTLDIFRPILGSEFISGLDNKNAVRELSIELHALKPTKMDEVEVKLARISDVSGRSAPLSLSSRIKVPGRLTLTVCITALVCLAIIVSGSFLGRQSEYQHIKSTSIQLPDSKPLVNEATKSVFDKDELIEDDADFYLDKAKMLEKINDRPAAIKTIRHALKDKPNNKRLLAELERLAR